MDKIYTYSKEKLKYIEIENFKKKFYTTIAIVSSLISITLFSLYFIITYFFDDSQKIDDLVKEKKKMAAEVIRISKAYKQLNKEMEYLIEKNNELRAANNLPPISQDEIKLGVGGSYSSKYFNVTLGISDVDVEKLYDYINRIETQIRYEKQNYQKLVHTINNKKNFYDIVPAILPANGYLGDSYGLRIHPILKRQIFHNGQDIVVDVGTPVKATGNGKVEFAGQKVGYGNVLIINHGYGYKTVYAHLSQILVKEKQVVKRGDIIAKSGNTGLSTGPHLHYEVWYKNTPLPPTNFFFDNFNVFQASNIN
ncbi:MAG TPA: M23 family metallopeptidase [Ignavibacteriales bacterium]|nr:M23 family metallopeptidase [Ignavibacteriales bacterium]HOL80633.1 M23 family metallopeptidase [Ignavibacteriales bacterium]HOM64321.1 M23 family metallopeptidase [Ignavibacteriales bacterium]HPD68019.1 M23 family metallopeptidase [Ignavibacteriales bacterium]HPP33033.1 M23 family metallopeptidase [Ignavibacteriales bacterium]